MLWSFVLASASVTLMPGPSLTVVLDRALRGPLSAGLAALAGVIVADALLLAVTISGLGALLAASPALLTLLKWAGAPYLVYLAWASWRAGPASANVDTTPTAGRSAFAQALGVTLLNPSIILFLLAFFPPFLRRDVGVAGQLLLLGPLFLATVATVLLGYVLLAHRLGRRVGGRGARWLPRLTALALLGGGLYTVLSG
jgi:threonine/homoserine/homoserine lactone efflux protein